MKRTLSAGDNLMLGRPLPRRGADDRRRRRPYGAADHAK